MSTIYLHPSQNHGTNPQPTSPLTLSDLPKFIDFPHTASTRIENHIANEEAVPHLAEFDGIPDLYHAIIIPTGDLSTDTGERGATILHIAIGRKDFPICKLILYLAPHLISAPDDDGDTPLLFAALEGMTHVVELLLDPSPLTDAKACVSETNNDGQSALHLALMSSHAETARSLVNWGCDKNLVDNDGLTPGDIARLQSLNFDLSHFPNRTPLEVADMFESLAQEFAPDRGLKTVEELRLIHTSETSPTDSLTNLANMV